jgi:hypothetical protein
MSWLRWSYRIGFVIALIAAIVWVVAAGMFSIHTRGPGSSSAVAPRDWDASSLAVLISGVTCLVTTITSFSTMILAWRLDRRQSREDRRQSRETSLRIAQLQVDLERSRQVKVDQS